MAKKDQTVAPKERVNITYKAFAGDAEEDVELPFRFLVVGDFTGRGDATPVEQRELVDVTKDNFDQVLEGKDVGVDLVVPDELSGKAGEELPVSLSFRKMKDFSPDAICEQVPELKALVQLRDALTVLKGPIGNVPAFRKRLQALLTDPEAQDKLLAELGLAGKGDGDGDSE